MLAYEFAVYTSNVHLQVCSTMLSAMDNASLSSGVRGFAALCVTAQLRNTEPVNGDDAVPLTSIHGDEYMYISCKILPRVITGVAA